MVIERSRVYKKSSVVCLSSLVYCPIDLSDSFFGGCHSQISADELTECSFIIARKEFGLRLMIDTEHFVVDESWHFKVLRLWFVEKTLIVKR